MGEESQTIDIAEDIVNEIIKMGPIKKLKL